MYWGGSWTESHREKNYILYVAVDILRFFYLGKFRCKIIFSFQLKLLQYKVYFRGDSAHFEISYTLEKAFSVSNSSSQAPKHKFCGISRRCAPVFLMQNGYLTTRVDVWNHIQMILSISIPNDV